MGESRDKIKVVSFEPDHIRVNLPALREMEQMREVSHFLGNIL